MNKPSQRFDALDAMRGIAALMVIARHTSLFGTSAAESHSYLAVDLFFMLSGFVIAHAYENHLIAGALTPMRFLAIRLVRLYPMFLVAVCLATVVALTRPEFEPNVLSKWTPAHSSALEILSSAALTLFFLPSRLGDSVLLFPLNTAFWSLMFEVVVNILYACVFGKLSLKVLVGLVIGSGFCLGALALRRNGLEMGWSWGLGSLVYGLLRAVFGFAAGILLMRLLPKRPPVSSNLRGLLLLSLLIAALAIPDLGRLNGVIDASAVILMFPLAIWFAAQVQAQGAVLQGFLWLGAASYPVYVLHVPLVILFERYTSQLGLGANPNMTVLLPAMFLAVLIPLAVFLDRHYEQRVRRAIINRYGLRATRPTVPAPTAAQGAPEIQQELAAYDRVIASSLESAESSQKSEQPLPSEQTLNSEQLIKPDQRSRPEPSANKS